MFPVVMGVQSAYCPEQLKLTVLYEGNGFIFEPQVSVYISINFILEL
jgi:hypothetical protein